MYEINFVLHYFEINVTLVIGKNYSEFVELMWNRTQIFHKYEGLNDTCRSILQDMQ